MSINVEAYSTHPPPLGQKQREKDDGVKQTLHDDDTIGRVYIKQVATGLLLQTGQGDDVHVASESIIRCEGLHHTRSA